MRPIIWSLATVAAVAVTGCNLDLTNPNNPTVSGALSNPRAATTRMIVGVMATYRANRPDQIRAFGSFGRETYYMFITDGRFITGPLRDWRQNNSFDAGTQWGARYGNYRNAYEAEKIVNTTTALTAAEKAGALGVLDLFEALDMLHVIEARGPIGAVVDMTDDPNAVLPVVSQDSTYGWISAKLDASLAELNAAGATFYFPIYNGFGVGVPSTPAGFAEFNRAIKARVEVKRGSLGCATCYATALTALGGTWIDTTASINNGVYVIYSTAAGDALNTVGVGGSTANDEYVHPGIDSIPGVTLDNRWVRKIGSGCPASSPRSEVGVSATHRPCTYASNTASIPVVRNEELWLIRAEAEWFTGAKAAAIADLGTVRTKSGGASGGTPAVAFAAPVADSQFVRELLLQRTLSLYQEAQRWPDYRRFGRLADLGKLPQDVAAGFTVATASVLPNQECDSRNRAGNPGGIPMSCPNGPPVP
ncbi:MAG TPA: RagB/SusD family nutrient uptake outer membrane protein [Gemmatimonadales bacterium]|nr:RagB/SusD family nutrient uptake outer membrane protein [Gemmatimonadales bacterium]